MHAGEIKNVTFDHAFWKRLVKTTLEAHYCKLRLKRLRSEQALHEYSKRAVHE